MSNNVHTIDQLPLPNEDHFIFQNGKEPSQLNGPLKLKNLEAGDSIAYLSIDAEGKIVLSKALTEKVQELRTLILEQLETLAEARVSAAVQREIARKKAIFLKGKWSGDDLGSAEERIVNIFSSGEFFGLRLENSHGVPESSAKNVGRLLLNTIDEKVYLDLGYKFKRISTEKVEINIHVGDPTLPIQLDLKESDIDDATRTIWQVCNSSNHFLRVNAKITTPNEKTVVVELPEGSPVGTYRILGVE